MIAKEL